MRRNIIIVLLVLVLIVEIYFVFNFKTILIDTNQNSQPETNNQISEDLIDSSVDKNDLDFLPQAVVNIEERVFNVFVADTLQTRNFGLSNQNRILDGEGMLFVFEETDIHSFWMKDTKFNLDIIWINNDEIVEIADNLSAHTSPDLPPANYTPTQKANFVLEISGGLSNLYGFEVGGKVFINFNPSKIPSATNLNIPFAVQAPFANWGNPYQEACEEASVLMAVKYFEGAKTLSHELIDEEILKMVDYSKEAFGNYKDSDIAEIADLLEGFYGYTDYEIIRSGTLDDIKQAVAQGYPVIVPAAGQLLDNPYFKQPGPIYHTIVVTGYNDATEEFIANDPGTKRGEGIRFSYENIDTAWHDWTGNSNTILEGERNLLVIKGK